MDIHYLRSLIDWIRCEADWKPKTAFPKVEYNESKTKGIRTYPQLDRTKSENGASKNDTKSEIKGFEKWGT